MNRISGEPTPVGRKGTLARAALFALIVLALSSADPTHAGTATNKVDWLETGRQHWAFQPVRRHELPPIKNSSWPRNPIDHFILAQLEAAKIQPIKDADRHTWLRRVTFDLIGLPPQPQEISQFLQDASPQAAERVVDRLLANPAFGERWARYWLDLVGYADQLGTVNDVPAPHAWRYRDYVIRSLNADKPFDQFIREQIAGDTLPIQDPQQRQDAITATGFLLLGEIHIVTSDKDQLKADIIDHQIQKIGLTFLGQSLGCVRCHDHKFDPIKLEDYYALAGILGSAEASYVTDRGVWSSLLTTALPETPEQHAARETSWKHHQELVTQTQAERTSLTNQLALLSREPAKAGTPSAPTVTNTPDLKARKSELEKQISSLDLRLLHLNYIEPKANFAYALRESAKPADGRVMVRGNVHAPAQSVPRGFIRVMSRAPWPKIPSGESGRLQLAEWLVNPENPLPARVTVNRLWQRLMGEGLVRSLDYFGTRGERPTHPELLDWLAGEFLRTGWSQKRLIREIVLSRTYALSSLQDATAAARDPDNRLLWRMNRRRLDAESLRDAVLAATGQLLPSSGGPALALHLQENVGGLDPKDVNPVSFRTSKFPETQHYLRTIYLPVVRSRAQPGPAELRNLFDFVPPTEMTGQRPSTSVATQALFLMNSDFMKSHAAKLADRLLNDSDTTDRERLMSLYLQTLNRPPQEQECQMAEEFLATPRATDPATHRRAWTSYCHALLSSNEFLFRL